MYINATAESVKLYFQHDFYNIIFKTKHKYVYPHWQPPQMAISGCALGPNCSSTLRVVGPWGEPQFYTSSTHKPPKASTRVRVPRRCETCGALWAPQTFALTSTEVLHMFGKSTDLWGRVRGLGCYFNISSVN
jgi:hypothetical protein